MTRRKIIFMEPLTKRILTTSEFNGDRDEFQLMRSSDRCDMSWHEMLGLFRAVKTKDDFIASVIIAQRCYHSFLDAEHPAPEQPVQEVGLLNTLTADEIIKLNF